jgi:hypothetical protein
VHAPRRKTVTSAGLHLIAVDWGYVAFWTVFGVVCALVFLVAYLLFRRWRSHRSPGEPF